MEKIYGKIKDVHQLIQAAFELAKIDGVSPGIQSSIAELNSRLTNKIDGGHFQKNIRKLVEDLYADTKMHEVGINFSSPYLDGLSMLLYKVPFVQQFGPFTGEFIFNKSKKAVENYKYRLPNPGPVQNVSSPKDILFALPKFQETLIPILYRADYIQHSTIVFQDQYEWGEVFPALSNGLFDMTIHNFPLILAYMLKKNIKQTLFFWPYLTFNGYALFVKKANVEKFCKERGIPVVPFGRLDNDQQQAFLLLQKVTLDVKTDFGFILRDYLQLNGLNWDLVRNNVVPANIKDGKSLFLKDARIGLYVTNTIHTEDLILNHADKVELVTSGDRFTRHRNYNGLLCTMEFYQNNKPLVKNTILQWFKNIASLKAEWNFILYNEGRDELNYFLTTSLLNFINTDTKSNVKIIDFVKSYRNNHFFSNPNEAFDSLYHDALKDPKAKRFNWLIAQAQLGDENTTIDNDLLDEIIAQMNAIKIELNF